MPCRSLCALALLAPALLTAQSYTAPAGSRPALRREGPSILPGGRIIAPYGKEYATGPGPFAIALSPSGRGAAIANAGPWRYTVTVLERDKAGHWEPREIDPRSPAALDDFGIPRGQGGEWRGVSNGVAFAGEQGVWISEGNSGRVALYDSSEERRRAIDLNSAGFSDSFTGALAYDAARGILYVADQANFRVAVVDTKARQVIASARVGRLPFALALSSDRLKLYVCNVGVYQYHMVPDAGAANAATAGLDFPPLPPPGADAPEANSLAIVDVSAPAAPKVEGFVRTGNSPSAIVAAGDRIYVSDAGDDSIAAIDPAARAVTDRIELRIPGFETLRGVIPLGMAIDEASGSLLVAEAGINAVGVIDLVQKRVLGHIPVAWYPTAVAVDGGDVLVANARGHGIGPNAPTAGMPRGALLPSHLFQGTVSLFKLPARADLPALTETVMRANGFVPARTPLPAAPPAGHVVLIVKEGRSYDEVLGDITAAESGPAIGDAEIARYGLNGVVEGGHQRLSLKGVRVTPNAHAIAARWAFSDNFYADGDGTVDGHHWLNGVAPNGWTESSLLAAYGNLKDFRMSAAPGRLSFAGLASSMLPEDAAGAATLWTHLAAHGISFYNFGEALDLPGAVQRPGMGPPGARYLTDMPIAEGLRERTSRQYYGFNAAISDQQRADALIAEVDAKFVKGGAELPRFLYIYLPGDAAPSPDPAGGHPYKESFIADNDLALGRILEYLSSTKWWRDMAVFVTESTAAGGVDHISANRTLLLAAGPWVKRGYVSHVNTSFPGLLKTIFWLLGAPPLNLFDAAAADLRDCFGAAADDSPYRAAPVDPRMFAPGTTAGQGGR